MFKLTELRLKNWCQHEALTLKFCSGTNGIVGSNGRGKSNALAAAFTLITGRVTSGNIDDNICYSSDKATISLDFEQDGTIGNVTREFMAKRTDEPGVREKCKSKGKLTFGDAEPITTTSKVTAGMSDITGMAPGVIENHIFISQDKVVSLLFQTKSERLKSFLDLIDEVRRAEPLRGQLDSELKLYPDVEVATDIDALESQQKELRAEIYDAQAKHSECDAGKVDIASLDDIIARYTAASTAVTDKLEAERKLSEYTAAMTELIVQQADADGILAKECNRVEELRPLDKTAREAQSNSEQLKTIFDTKQRVQTELTTLLGEIDSRGIPDDGGKPWTDIETKQVEASKLYSDIDAATRTLALIQDSDNCPTCGSPFKDVENERAKQRKIKDELTPKHTALSAEIISVANAKSTYDIANAAHQTWVAGATQRLTALQADLAKLPDVTLTTPEQLEENIRIIREFTELQEIVTEAETDSTSIKTTMSVTQAKIEAINENLEKLNLKIVAMPTTNDYNGALVTRQQQLELADEISRLSGIISAKEQELARLETSLTNALKAQERAKSVRVYRQLLTVARETLHREKLPQEVLFSYIGELDQLCNKFLNLFGNPFAISIERDMNMNCIMPSGYITTADRLSGGQKCVLAVAMRFAINELFAKDLGLLILDEPTAWMDEDNIECMGELITNVHQISKESGVQTIIITHARELIPSFEHVIQIG